MPDSSPTNSKIVAAYREKTPRSEAMAQQARNMFPSGITHDSRRITPYAIYVDRALGSRKWDVDGNEYVDYYGGHGALILGHNHPKMLEAVHRQLDRGTHFGACHELEVRWAELIRRLIPSAEKVRFTSSGTEANLMALRLARAHTGRGKLVRFLGHFHGWQDHVAFGVSNHFDGTPTPGVLPGIAENVLLVPPGDVAALQQVFDAHGKDIAAVILEPTGASFGQTPLGRDFVAELRRITEENGTVLIFDEVVTGFRVSKGGAQAHYGITPDLTSLAKIVAGGLPGGAVCGRKAILDHLDFDVATAKGFEKIGHQGTFNANPMSAAAGIATLEIVAETDVCERANTHADKLRRRLNEVFEEEKVPWAAYGTFSGFNIFSNPQNLPIRASEFDPGDYDYTTFKSAGGNPAVNKFRLGGLIHGLDISGKPGGITSAAHTDEDLEVAATAARESLRMLKEEGDLR